MTAPQVLSRFRGSLLGVLIGDCCGAPFHGQNIIESGERIVLRKYFDKLEGPFFKGKKPICFQNPSLCVYFPES